MVAPPTSPDFQSKGAGQDLLTQPIGVCLGRPLYRKHEKRRSAKCQPLTHPETLFPVAAPLSAHSSLARGIGSLQEPGLLRVTTGVITTPRNAPGNTCRPRLPNMMAVGQGRRAGSHQHHLNEHLFRLQDGMNTSDRSHMSILL